LTKKITIGEACNITTGKLDSNEFVEGGDYPFYTCAKDPYRIDHYAFDDDAILVAGNNAAGNFHLNRFSGKFNAYQRTYVLTSKGVHNLDYIYYSLTILLKQLKDRSQGSQTKFLTIGLLRELKLNNFSIERQDKIAAVLSALDAKIALNHRINDELEGLAKLLYDYWFVQYDFPLSAAQAAALGKPKLADQPYRTSGGPMVYHEQLKREIPKGWVAKELSDIAESTMGQSPPGNTYNNEQNGVLFFQGSTDFGWRYPSPRQYTTAPTRMARKGDILLSVRAPVGTLNIAPEECAIGRGLSALRSKSGSSSFLFQILQNLQQVFARRNGDGTTFGSINRDDLRSLQLAYPSEEDIIHTFDKIVSETDALIFANHQQNQELTALRDWLLPMLMNGQVRVECPESRGVPQKGKPSK
jgi:type I restriction enzyme, S subunit